jgi:hypothetical protein
MKNETSINTHAISTDVGNTSHSTKVIVSIITALAMFGTLRYLDHVIDAAKQAKIEHAERLRGAACLAVFEVANLMDEKKMDVNSPILSQAFYDNRVRIDDNLGVRVKRLGDHEFSVVFNEHESKNFPDIVKAYSHVTVAQAIAHKCP